MEYLVFTSNWPKQEHSEITGEAKRVFCDSHLKREEAPQCEPRFPPSARHCLAMTKQWLGKASLLPDDVGVKVTAP